MWKNDRPPLPEWIQDAYGIIVAHVNDPDEGLPRERAREVCVIVEVLPDCPGVPATRC